MHKKILFSLFGVAALSLAACGGSETTKPGVEDKSVGTGATDTGAKGKPLDAKADVLSKRRVHFTFDSSAVDGENRAIVEAHAAYLAANKNIKVVRYDRGGGHALFYDLGYWWDDLRAFLREHLSSSGTR